MVLAVRDFLQNLFEIGNFRGLNLAIFESLAGNFVQIHLGTPQIWQISGRSEITNFDDWVKLDLEYIDNWSLYLDLKILMKTIPAVFLNKGAK